MRAVIGFKMWLFVAFMIVNVISQSSIGQQADVPQDRPAAELTSSVDSVQIAEPFEISIIVTCGRGAKLNFPAVDRRFGSFDVIDHVDQFDLPSEQDPDIRTWIRRMTVETLDTGQLETPPFEIAVVTGAGQRLKLTPTPLTINVVSVLEENVDARKFNDIKNVIDVEIEPDKSYAWVAWMVGGVFCAVLLASGTIFATRRKRWITPAQWALSQLDNSNSQEVSDIETTLRLFIEQEFGFRATSFSIEQVHAELTQRKISPQTCEKVCNLMRRSEQVRFAGLLLKADEVKSLRIGAIEVINQMNNAHEEVG